MKTIKLFIAIISLAILALMTGCSGGGTPSGDTKVGLKVVFSNTSSAGTIRGLGIASAFLEIIPVNPAIAAQPSMDLMTTINLQKTITLPDPVAPATQEPYLFRITAWSSGAKSSIIYSGQSLVNIAAGNNTINLTAFAFNGFDSVAGKYTVNASDGTFTPLTIDSYGVGTGTSSGRSNVKTYIAPTSSSAIFDVITIAKDSVTNSLNAYGGGSFNASTGSGSGSVTDLSGGGTKTWTVAKNLAFTSVMISGKTFSYSSSDGRTGTITYDAAGTYSNSNGSSGTWSINTAGQLLITSPSNVATLSLTANTATTFAATESDTNPPGALYTVTGTLYTPPPPPTTPTAQSIIQSTMYSGKTRAAATGPGTAYYATEGIGLAADGVNLTDVYSYYDSTSHLWTATRPTSLPPNLFANTAYYYLTPTSGWVSASNGPQNYTMVFNTDGSATITNKTDSSKATMAFISTDVSGQTIASQVANLRWWPILSTAGLFPTGSTRYDMTWTNLGDSYALWSTNVIPGVTAVSQVPLSAPQGYLDSSDQKYSYSLQFQSTGKTVTIYQTPVGGTAPTPLQIGFGNYTTNTLGGQQMLEVRVPSNLRTNYKLGGNPIYGVVGGAVYGGSHEVPGISYSNGNTSWNSTAITHLKNSIDTAIAKSVSSAILGW